MRRGIPFYHAKSEAEFRQDVYERYDELVTRQTALHLADELHEGYPFQALLDYLRAWLPGEAPTWVVDVGCSVGRLLAEVGRIYPNAHLTGIDLSYQMLRQARDYWVLGQAVRPNLMRYGWGTPALQHPPLANLTFALARAEELPFETGSIDLLLNTFLLDRLEDPLVGLAEFARVLRPGGRLLTVTPLNFLRPALWRTAHPPVKLLNQLLSPQWTLLDWTDPLPLLEPMDARGNGVAWKCIAFSLERNSG